MRQLLLTAVFQLAALAAAAQTAPALPADQCRIEATYRLSYRPDSTAPATRTELMRLQLGSKLSRFASLNAARQDSIMNALVARAESMTPKGENININVDGTGFSTLQTKFKEVIYKVPTANQVAVYDEIGAVRYVYQEEAAPVFAWTILPATATIGGYACQRATAAFGGRTWEAWFAREVPVPDGPYKFYGLPGLIIKVGDTRGHYDYELLKLRRPPAPAAIALPEPGARPITKAAFVRGKAEYERTAFERLLASGNIRFGTPEQAEAARLRSRQRAKKPTNPLELR